MNRFRLKQQIRNDSPDLIELEIGTAFSPFGYVPDDHDWAGLGRNIGQLAHLKKLHFHVRDEDFRHPLNSDGGVEHLFRGVASNQSIETLNLLHGGNGTIMRDGIVFGILRPFFKNNRKFERLSLSEKTPFRIETMTSPCLQRLTKALGEFTGLKEFELIGSCTLPGELFQALYAHTSLEELVIFDAKIERDGCVALSALLQKPDLAIQILKLWNVTILYHEWEEVLGSGLAGSRSLREIWLNGTICGCDWHLIFTALQNSSCSILEKYHLCFSGLGLAALDSLFRYLTNQPNLKKLNLEGMITSSEVAYTNWGAVFRFLMSQENRLEELDLSRNILNRDLIHLLGTSLAQNSTLKQLALNKILTTPSDWEVLTASISNILANRNSALERLDLRSNRFIEFNEMSEALISLAASLENNTSLKELCLEYDDEEEEEDMPPVTPQAWGAFSSVVCSKTSIIATYTSNHTLQQLELPGVPRDIVSLLELNKESNGQAAYLKIINAHFSGDFDVQPFVEMDMKVLPHAVAWMARGRTLNGMYQLVKNIGSELPS